MGRGGSDRTQAPATPRRANAEHQPFHRGQRFRDPQGRELEIIHAAEFAHRGLVARDGLGIRLVDPKLLTERYEPVDDGEPAGEPIDVSEPAPLEIEGRASMMIGGREAMDDIVARLRKRGILEEPAKSESSTDSRRNGPMTEPQANLLRDLAAKAGEKFDDSLTLAEASKEIDRLKALLAERKRERAAA